MWCPQSQLWNVSVHRDRVVTEFVQVRTGDRFHLSLPYLTLSAPSCHGNLSMLSCCTCFLRWTTPRTRGLALCSACPARAIRLLIPSPLKAPGPQGQDWGFARDGHWGQGFQALVPLTVQKLGCCLGALTFAFWAMPKTG